QDKQEDAKGTATRCTAKAKEVTVDALDTAEAKGTAAGKNTAGAKDTAAVKNTVVWAARSE
ncbi:hypothetical protein PF007_g32326, partial [Phytophthora fragariae]